MKSHIISMALTFGSVFLLAIGQAMYDLIQTGDTSSISISMMGSLVISAFASSLRQVLKLTFTK